MNGNQGFGVQTQRNGYAANDDLSGCEEEEIWRFGKRLKQIWNGDQVSYSPLKHPSRSVSSR